MAKPVILPMFNMDMTEALLLRWMVEEGATVREGDPLCEVETDKVNMEVEAPAAGLVVGLKYPAGAVVPVTSVIAYIAIDAADAATVSAHAGPAPEATPAPAAARALSTAPAAAVPATPAPATPTAEPPAGVAVEPDDPYLTGGRRRATPAVRRLARQSGIALADISDRSGRVSLAALKAALVARGSTPAEPAREPAPAAASGLPATERAAASAPRPVGPTAVTAAGAGRLLEGTRKRIAERMVAAHEAPHITLVREVRVGELMRLRKTYASTAPSVTALIAAATVRALLAHPDLNSTFEGGAVIAHPEVSLGIAVARPEGLIVPVVHGAQNLSVMGLGDEMRRLSEAARTGRLAMAEITGGTFTITSLGQAGIDIFSPLINPPQVAILGVGRVADRVVPVPGGIGVVPTVFLSLTCDHRIIDGAPGAEFLDTLARELETPAWLGPVRREGEA